MTAKIGVNYDSMMYAIHKLWDSQGGHDITDLQAEELIGFYLSHMAEKENLVINCGEPSNDCCAAIGNFLLKLKSEGHDACPISIIAGFQRGFEAGTETANAKYQLATCIG